MPTIGAVDVRGGAIIPIPAVNAVDPVTSDTSVTGIPTVPCNANATDDVTVDTWWVDGVERSGTPFTANTRVARVTSVTTIAASNSCYQHAIFVKVGVSPISSARARTAVSAITRNTAVTAVDAEDSTDTPVSAISAVTTCETTVSVGARLCVRT